MMPLEKPDLTEGSVKLLHDLVAYYPALECCREPIENACRLLVETFKSGSKLLVCGNGGSAADAEHISGELMKGFLKKRPLPKDIRIKLKGEATELEWVEQLQGSLPVIPLTANGPLASAISNDISADLIFAQQVLGYGRPGDALLAISTSGSSLNVLRAVTVANSLGLQTIGLTGRSGGALKDLCRITIQVPAVEVFRIQEYHLPVYHALSAILEEELFNRDLPD